MQSCRSVHHVHRNHIVHSLMSKKNLSAGGSLPWGWGRQLLLPVHHHTELFVAELVVLQMYFLFVFFLLHVDINLFFNIRSPFHSLLMKTNSSQPKLSSRKSPCCGRILWKWRQPPFCSDADQFSEKSKLVEIDTEILKRCFDILQGAKINLVMNTIKVFCRLRLTCEAIISSCFEM